MTSRDLPRDLTPTLAPRTSSASPSPPPPLAAAQALPIYNALYYNKQAVANYTVHYMNALLSQDEEMHAAALTGTKRAGPSPSASAQASAAASPVKEPPGKTRGERAQQAATARDSAARGKARKQQLPF